MSAPLATTHVSSDTRPREDHEESFQVTVRAADEKRRRAVGSASQVEPTVGTSSSPDDPPEREATLPKSKDQLSLIMLHDTNEMLKICGQAPIDDPMHQHPLSQVLVIHLDLNGKL